MKLLKNMNELFRSGWSVTLIQHKMGKESSWFRDTLRRDEYEMYEDMKKFYNFWRKRTAISERLPCYFESKIDQSLH